ncbi:MAG: type II toxin-antitoxin system PemK/MazF family toxin [Candidatus Aminicenantes bacterium]|nr:type II toxin-antitoxin system PemK/MazF family toxin [Candidatus Aminicenantes bacterium]
MVIKRGSIWWADLGLPLGSGPGYRRPVLVIQSDDFNKSKINTVIVVPITSNLRLAEAPGNVFLKKEDCDLEKDSVINVSQIITVDKQLLTELIGSVNPKYIKRVEQGVKTVLSLR